MDDAQLMERINALVEEEHQLHQNEASGALVGDAAERLRRLEVSLDQCWDLLRQRRARRHAGLDEDGADVRPAAVVEGYQQ